MQSCKTNNTVRKIFSLSFVLVLVLGLFTAPLITSAEVVREESYVVSAYDVASVSSGSNIWYPDKSGNFLYQSGSARTFLFGLSVSDTFGNIVTNELYYNNSRFKLEFIKCDLQISVLRDEGFGEPDRRFVNSAFRVNNNYGQNVSGRYTFDDGTVIKSETGIADITYYQDGGVFTNSQLVQNMRYNFTISESVYFNSTNLPSPSVDDLINFYFYNFQAVGDPFFDVGFNFVIDRITFTFKFVDIQTNLQIQSLNSGLQGSNRPIVQDSNEILGGWLAQQAQLEALNLTWQEQMNNLVNYGYKPQDLLGDLTSDINSLNNLLPLSYMNGLFLFLGNHQYIWLFVTCGIVFAFACFLLKSLL